MNQQQNQAAYAAYRSSGEGATGIARTIMLYDQMAARLVDARGKWEAQVFDAAFESVRQAAAIVATLSATLDDRASARLGNSLRCYYRGLSFQILGVPRQKDPLARIDSLLRQVKEVRDAWAQVLAQQTPRPGQGTTIHKEASGASLA